MELARVVRAHGYHHCPPGQKGAEPVQRCITDSIRGVTACKEDVGVHGVERCAHVQKNKHCDMCCEMRPNLFCMSLSRCPFRSSAIHNRIINYLFYALIIGSILLLFVFLFIGTGVCYKIHDTSFDSWHLVQDLEVRRVSFQAENAGK